MSVQLQADRPRQVAFYIRVSTERQARVEEGSLKNQEQMLQAELERRNGQRKGWGAFLDTYVDEGVSGKTTNRPAFQRLMGDIERGRVNTVLFTELSRLSRSLKDFLNIFEFTQRHGCDLVCLKTEIDTTSPYQGLVTKILVVFSEFEREMTSRRTALHAYERGKRGLAGGGQTLLGYRRDRRHKGRLLVEEGEAEVVRAIYTTYLEEQSIRRTTERIRALYEGQSPRLKRLHRSKVHGVLTRRAYLGIREIRGPDSGKVEEVPAAWPPLIEEPLFRQVQEILQANKDHFHRRGGRRYTYLLSGLLRCGACGEKLQGKSAWSNADRRHRYYAHRSACPQGGLGRIDAEVAQGLVLSWLRELAENGERFRTLEAQGRVRLGREIASLRETAGHLVAVQANIRNQVEARIGELTRARAEAVRDSIEKSIIRLQEKAKETEERLALVHHSISELENLIFETGNLYSRCRSRIQEVLEKAGNELKTGLKSLLSSQILEEKGIKVALAGVTQKGPISAVSRLAPPERLELPT